jgi:hypothetical protein
MKICVPGEFGEIREIEDEELFDTNSPSGSVLSANAEPYHPPLSYYEPIEIAIYNDGVPCLTLISEQDRCELLHNIPDEAIDEGFPLDAVDAAEIEAMEEFVVEMANLSMLEEREETARKSFNHVKKRWEARRQKGPSGHGPKPRMNLIIPTEHVMKTPPHHQPLPSSLISYSHTLRVLDERMRAKEVIQSSSLRIEPRHSKTCSNKNNKIRRPIQQPRKDS